MNDVYVAKWVNYREYAYSALYAVAKDVMDASGKYGTYITAEKAVGSKALVPIMTSNTCDMGTVSSGAYDTDSNKYLPYVLFDGTQKDWSNSTGNYGFRGTTVPNYIQYTFNAPTMVKEVMYVPRWNSAQTESPKNAVLQVSLDNGSTWTDVSDTFTQSEAYTSRTEVRLTANESHYSTHWRVYFDGTNIAGNTTVCCIDEMQFYGHQLIGLVPTLTSNNGSDGGVASASSELSDVYKAFNVFDGSSSTRWTGASTVTSGCYLQYKFANPTCVNGISMSVANATNVAHTERWVLQISDDGSIWENVDEANIDFTYDSTSDDPQTKLISFNNAKRAIYARIVLDSSTAAIHGAVWSLQFYGTEKWQPKGLVPVMTSNAAPYGEASASGNYDANHSAYVAFNGSDTGWASNQKTTDGGEWISYKFPTPAIVNSVGFKIYYTTTYGESRAFNAILQGSNDGSSWSDITTLNVQNMADRQTFSVNNTTAYMYYKLTSVNSGCLSDGKYFTQYIQLQFYGRQLEALVPPMTSNTAPVGEVSASDVYDSTSDAYMAFNKSVDDYWGTNTTSSSNQWIQYKFEQKVCAKCVEILPIVNPQIRVKNFIVQASNDGESFIDLYEGVYLSGDSQIFSFENDESYEYYRLKVVDTYGGFCVCITELQFYGTPDYDSRTYIYDHGVELMAMGDRGTSSGNSVEKTSDSILWIKTNTTVASSNYAHAGMLELIDTTEYDLAGMTASVETSDSHGALYAVNHADIIQSSTFSPAAENTMYRGVNPTYLDMTNVNGEHSIIVSLGYNATVGRIYINELWLE